MKNAETYGPERSIDDGCRHLAVRVIDQAFRDLSDSGGSRANRDSARAFLAGSWMLYRWCEIANVNASWTIARARTLDRAFQSNTSRTEGGRSHVADSLTGLDRRRHLVRGTRQRDRDQYGDGCEAFDERAPLRDRRGTSRRDDTHQSRRAVGERD
jgi:hypothetical protein